MLKRILFPTDLLKASLDCTPQIVDLARKLGARVEILHVYGKSVPPPSQESAERTLAPFVAEFKNAGVEVDTRYRYGRPDEEILHEIEDGDFELVVVPFLTRPWGGTELPPDPTALRVARRTTCNILLIRSPGRE